MAASRRWRFSKIPRRTLPAAFLLAAVLVGLQKFSEQAVTPRPETTKHLDSHVAKVVDGDTIVMAKDKERVRLIGVDTPESVKPNSPVQPWGPEACAFTKDFLSSGEVRLEFDGPRRDKYGRLLAYVWVGDRMLNEELLRAGLARAELKYQYSAAIKTRFRQAENEAKAGRRGIWSTQTSQADR